MADNMPLLHGVSPVGAPFPGVYTHPAFPGLALHKPSLYDTPPTASILFGDSTFLAGFLGTYRNAVPLDTGAEVPGYFPGLSVPRVICPDERHRLGDDDSRHIYALGEGTPSLHKVDLSAVRDDSSLRCVLAIAWNDQLGHPMVRVTKGDEEFWFPYMIVDARGDGLLSVHFDEPTVAVLGTYGVGADTNPMPCGWITSEDGPLYVGSGYVLPVEESGYAGWGQLKLALGPDLSALLPGLSDDPFRISHRRSVPFTTLFTQHNSGGDRVYRSTTGVVTGKPLAYAGSNDHCWGETALDAREHIAFIAPSEVTEVGSGLSVRNMSNVVLSHLRVPGAFLVDTNNFDFFSTDSGADLSHLTVAPEDALIGLAPHVLVRFQKHENDAFVPVSVKIAMRLAGALERLRPLIELGYVPPEEG